MKTVLAIIILSLSALGQNPPKPEPVKPVPLSDAAQVKVLKAIVQLQTLQQQAEKLQQAITQACTDDADAQKIDLKALRCDAQQLAFVPKEAPKVPVSSQTKH